MKIGIWKSTRESSKIFGIRVSKNSKERIEDLRFNVGNYTKEITEDFKTGVRKKIEK